MQRQLGAFESALTLSDEHAPLNVVAVLRLTVGPSPAALRRALAAVQARHPLLRVGIGTVNGRYVFDRGGTAAITLRLAERGDGEAWIGEAEAELNARLDAGTGPPVRCVYLQPRVSGPPGGRPRSPAVGRGSSGRPAGEDGLGQAADPQDRLSGAEILLTLHHAVMDGASAVSLCRELLAACAAAEGGDDPEIGAPLAMLPAAEELFPPAFQGRRRLRLVGFVLRQLGREIAERWRARGRWHAPPPGPTRSRILCFRLSEAETAALVRRSRKRRLTLHSVFDAALLLAVLRHLYPGQSLPLRHLVFADLRPYLRPPVAAENLGAYFAMLRLCSALGPDRGLWDLAREINAGVHAAARRGEKYLFSLTSAAAMRHLIRSGTGRMAATAVSYTGAARLGAERLDAERLDAERLDAERLEAERRLPVTALHAFVSNFRLGPEYTAQVRLFNRRIWWDILYLEPELDEDLARRIAGEIRDLLLDPQEPP